MGDDYLDEEPPIPTLTLYEHFVKEKPQKLKDPMEVQSDEDMSSEDESDEEYELIPSTVILEEIESPPASPLAGPSAISECSAIEDARLHPSKRRAVSENEEGRGIVL